MALSPLPAAPLAVLVDRIVSRAAPDDGNHANVARTFAYEAMQISPRTLYAWRAPRATVSPLVADRVLSGTPYLWFDVWPECEKHKRGHRVSPSCAVCRAYFSARAAFTGKALPIALRRRKR